MIYCSILYNSFSTYSFVYKAVCMNVELFI